MRFSLARGVMYALQRSVQLGTRLSACQHFHHLIPYRYRNRMSDKEVTSRISIFHINIVLVESYNEMTRPLNTCRPRIAIAHVHTRHVYSLTGYVESFTAAIRTIHPFPYPFFWTYNYSPNNSCGEYINACCQYHTK